ncbi:MAG: hypothetical protein H7123_04255 [Thermoleophilia bacterium]|nr:hypothetical protein [Thermoleophilia bacterium]
MTVVGSGGTRVETAGAHLEQAGPDELDEVARRVGDKVRKLAGGAPLTEPGIVIYRDGQLTPETLSALALAFGFPRADGAAGSGFLAIPAGSNARGLAALGIEPVGLQTIADHHGGLVLLGVDLARYADDESWRPAVRSSAWVAATSMFHNDTTSEVDLIIPATGFQEKDGTTVNLEGRLQRMTVGASPRDGIKPELSWLAGIARRFGAVVPGHAAGAYRVAARAFTSTLPAETHADVPHDGLLGVTGRVLARPGTPASVTTRDGELVLQVAPFLYDGADVAHANGMRFLREQNQVTIARADAANRGLARGDRVTVGVVDGDEYHATVSISRRQSAGTARLFAGTCGAPSGRTGYYAATVAAAPGVTVGPGFDSSAAASGNVEEQR